jgi:hypothetical protein
VAAGGGELTDEPKQFSPRLAEMKRIAEAAGFKEAPPDHPIYSEGVTLSFLRATPKPSEKKPT